MNYVELTEEISHSSKMRYTIFRSIDLKIIVKVDDLSSGIPYQVKKMELENIDGIEFYNELKKQLVDYAEFGVNSFTTGYEIQIFTEKKSLVVLQFDELKDVAD